VLKNKMGVELIPVEIPKFPYDAMRTIYTTEGAAAFEEMTLSGRDKILYERSFDDDPSQVSLACPGNAAAAGSLATGVLARHGTAITHQFSSTCKARNLT
jgi:hypothetical protein